MRRLLSHKVARDVLQFTEEGVPFPYFKVMALGIVAAVGITGTNRAPYLPRAEQGRSGGWPGRFPAHPGA